MSSPSQAAPQQVLYEPDERPPESLAFGLGLQAAALAVGGIVLTPAIIIRAAEQSETYLIWAVFAALVISGISTIAQAVRFGRIGAGHMLIMGTSGAFIAVSVTALTQGGPAMLATLIVISSLIQFGLAARLALLRRIITPTVAGTVIALIAVTIMPIAFDMLADLPEGTAPAASPASAFATLMATVALALCASGALRIWAPMIGIAVGCVVASFFGLYDTGLVADAAWIGLPTLAWPGFDLSFDARFWLLLPAFVFVTLVGAVETVGDSVAIQNVSRRNRQAVDFRTVQGALNADGLGNLLSGLFGTMPNTTYSSSLPLVEITGVGSRRVGMYIGMVLIALAFLPKFTALLLAIPAPVIAAYVLVLMALLFVQGMKLVVQDGVSYRNAMIAGLAFWIGVGFQNDVIFADMLGETLGQLLGEGMTAGGLTAIVLVVFVELTKPRRRRLDTQLEVASLPEIEKLLRGIARRLDWNEASTERLCSAGEEALLSLVREEDDSPDQGERRLRVLARNDHGTVEIDFIASLGEENLEDRLILLANPTVDWPVERDISLRLLRHYASSVRHQQYHDIDILTLRVERIR